MNKKVFAILVGAVLSTTLTGCFEKEPDPKVVELEAQLERIEAAERAREAELAAELEKERAEKEAELAEAEVKDKERLEKELEELRNELKKARTVVVAPTPSTPSSPPSTPPPVTNKFGPGNGNNLQGYSDGYLRIHTRSANGKLTLRDSPDQKGNKILEISNGVDEIYYFDRTKIGEYVWYKVDYLGNVGYLRGDYVHRY